MLDDLMSNPWAYLPPKSSLWLWVGGPLLLLITYFITSKTWGSERKKRLREANIWRAGVGGVPAEPGVDNKQGAPYRPDPAKKDVAKPAKKDVGPRTVTALPVELRGALLSAGGGEAIAHYELQRGLAYLSLVEANLTAGSDFQTVTGLLEERGPSMVVHPLPLVDGVRVANAGVQFKKDQPFMDLFVVEGTDAKAIGRWLSRPIREALRELPNAWLRVEGRTMTVTVYGTLEADQLDALAELADLIFAEHGAEGGPSLFGDDADRPGPVSEAPAKKKPRVEPASATTLADSPMSKKKI